MHLERLPNELISDVLSYLSTGEQSELARASKKMKKLVYPILYKAPELTVERRLKPFTEISPEAQSYVRHLDLSRLKYSFINVLPIHRLKHMCNLKSLNLEGCSQLAMTTLEMLIQNCCYSLESLNIASCPVNNETLYWIGVAGRELLTWLNMEHTSYHSNERYHPDSPCDLNDMFSSHECPSRIRYLDLTLCRWVHSCTISNIANNMPYLESLVLESCPFVNTNLIFLVAQKMLALKELDVSYIPVLYSKETLTSIPNKSPSLKKIIYRSGDNTEYTF